MPPKLAPCIHCLSIELERGADLGREEQAWGEEGSTQQSMNLQSLTLTVPFSWLQQGLPSFSFPPEPLGCGEISHYA